MVKLNNDYKNIIDEEIENANIDVKIKMYTDNGADSHIIKILEAKKLFSSPRGWGDFMERIAMKIFNFDERDNTEHDYKKNGLKLEQKASTISLNQYMKYGKKVFQYNDIRDDYDYNGLILMNVDFDELKFYYVSKKVLKELDLFAKQKRCRMLNFNKIKDFVVEVTPENIDKVLSESF